MSRIFTEDDIAEHRARMARYRLQTQGPTAERVEPARNLEPRVTLAWPPSGNTGTRHTNDGGHYTNAKVVGYREVVAIACGRCGRVTGRYRLNVHMSPPDARARDIDNALKTVFDALVKASFIPSDSMTYMRELRVTVDDLRQGTVTIHAEPIDLEAA